MRVSPSQPAVLALALVVAPAAGWWSLRHGCVEVRLAFAPSLESARLAIGVAPASTEFQHAYLRAISSLDREEAGRAAARIVALNAYDEAAWIELGLVAEADGRIEEAEANLLRAAAVSRRYRPRWTLAGFYYRQQNEPRFWWWAREASLSAYDSATSLYRLCWNLAPDGRLLWDRLEPRRRQAREGLLRFLIDQPGSPGLAYAAQHAALRDDERTRELMLDACERLIGLGELAGSLAVWNHAAAARIIPYGALEAGVVTNARFEWPPVSRGFDWRIPALPGVSATMGEGHRALRLELDGTQPENSELLWQVLPVAAHKSYRLRSRYRLEAEFPEGSNAGGLHWSVAEARMEARPLAQGAPLSRGDDTEQVLHFETGPSMNFLRIALRYDRPLGAVRGESHLWLYSISVEQTP